MEGAVVACCIWKCWAVRVGGSMGAAEAPSPTVADKLSVVGHGGRFIFSECYEI